MPRKRVVTKREVLPDSKFQSQEVAIFINHLMLDGKKSIAEKVVYGALTVVAERYKKQQAKESSGDGSDEGEGGEGRKAKLANASLEVGLLDQALENVRPTVEVRSRRVGGATYQVPVEVRPSRRNTLAMRWLIIAARARGEKGMVLRLAGELLDAIGGKGNAVKKREDMHKMAKANQAFAHFRWT